MLYSPQKMEEDEKKGQRRYSKTKAKRLSRGDVSVARHGAIVRGAVQGSVLCWARWINREYLWPAHIKYISERLHALERGDIKRLIIETPPRHGKSMLVSIAFPGWFLGRNPDARVISASHTAMLASRNSRQVRNSLQEHGDKIFGQAVSKDSSAMDRWDMDGHSGGMLAAGIGGPLTGSGADLMIIDDPTKDAEQAYSKTHRDKIWDWWCTTARTRLHAGGKIVIVQTRWHQDDLVGRLLRAGGEEWERIRLPAIAEPEDQLEREIGEALWPDRYPIGDLEAVRGQIGSFAWSSLYQQNPVDSDGAIIKREWLRYYDIMPDDLTDLTQSWDLSFKETGASYVVGQVWGRKGSRRYLLDQFRKRCSFTDTIAAFRAMCEKWPNCKAKLVEDKANGPAVISALSDSIPGIIPVTPKGGKESRLRAVEPQFEAGNVYLPSSGLCPWMNDFEEELLTFPSGPFDDQVDAASMALNRYRQDGNTVEFRLGNQVRQSPWKV